ncbi:hypothetical protein GCM10025771_08330 [Niveibacterium umoris]|uniref:HD-GYP domain-containing protein (C-di-GMP phosphodiesterase class II) n=1 Tax=Niveibacterium umoris TaxID=1193620 RepID=A0A840BQ73_9RHOO|nr:HD domain-containing phosphohydrolase [Niveibacterium umoris]MBB4013619.1 HD-GYP domain-containing protein (c-di-GMP phosphodiesterase class II) [Niveibacterium umoris]
MKLLQLLADHVKVGVPLLWNVRDRDRNLLLSRGNVVQSEAQLQALLARGMYVDEVEYRSQRAASEKPKPQAFDPIWLWSDLQTKLSLLMRENSADPEFLDKLGQLSMLMQLLIERDADVGIFVMMQADAVKYAVSHSVHTAVIAELIAKKVGASDDERRTIINAALTMNLGMFELQAILAAQATPPTDQQRAAIRAHPARSVAILQQAGLKDVDWLRAVAEHHETPDGKGYPRGIKDISVAAELIRHADVFAAKISPRATRSALPPNRAARESFLSMGGQENPMAALLVKEVGIFPPGAFVRLANGEVAIVLRRGQLASTPTVFSVTNSNGVPYIEPVRRDTARKDFTIDSIVPRQSVMVRVNPSRLYGYDKG